MRINRDMVPSTVEAAARLLVDSMSNDDRRSVQTDPDIDVAVHHSVGDGIRNSWSLWEPDSPLKRDAAETFGIAHADDISGLIIAWACAIARGEKFSPEEHCSRYHEHWIRMGTNSLSAGGWTADS